MKKTYKKVADLLIVSLRIILCFGLALYIKVNPNHYVGTSALSSLVSGQAAQYRDECEERFLALHKDDIQDVCLKKFTNPPTLLVDYDISTDSTDWINVAIS